RVYSCQVFEEPLVTSCCTELFTLSSSSRSPPPPSSTLFPYTTLFRSRCAGRCRGQLLAHPSVLRTLAREDECDAHVPDSRPWIRSEEHTSELQSRENLVCRLLLEKKKR